MRRIRGAQAAVVGIAALAAVTPMPATAVERWYSTAWFPAVQRVVTPLSNLVPFAWLDVLIIAGAIALGALLWRAVRRTRRTRTIRPLLDATADICSAGAIVYLAFLALWGLNYRRLPMAERLVVSADGPNREAVLRLGHESVRRLNELHTTAHAAGWRRDGWRDERLRASFAAAQSMLADASPAVPGRLKWSLLGPYFRWASVDGMVNPFALEVLANPDLLPWETPFVAAHEWAHLAGFAHEAEANFLGWLACVRGDAPTQYSGWLFLYWQLAGEVSRSDASELAEALDAGPQRDVAAIVERLRRGQVPRLRRASWRVYDGYLRANRVEEGVRSYGEVVNLILRARFDEDWVPARRSR
jgi:Protein of unknown function (DUF3810)